jgi:hypothetical protein
MNASTLNKVSRTCGLTVSGSITATYSGRRGSRLSARLMAAAFGSSAVTAIATFDPAIAA